MRIMAGLVASVMFFATQAMAFENLGSVVAQGGVVYKMPSGELVTRDVTLEVPARGEGEVVLRSGDWEVRTTKFKSGEVHGRKVFVVVFENVPGAPEGAKAIYHGTYLRGTNRAIYYGDIWAASANQDVDLALNLDKPKHTHAGGFYVATEISE